MDLAFLEDKLYFLTKQYEETQDQNLFEDIELVFRDYLQDNPQSNDVWIRLALFLDTDIVSCSDKSIEILEQLVLHDDQNIKALLILADVQHFSAGGISKDVIERLFNFRTDDNEIMSMIEYAKARYCFYHDQTKYEEYLIRSINLYSRHVNNNKELGRMYIEKGKIKEGCRLTRQALISIKYVFPETFFYVGPLFILSSADEYLAEFITGTIKTSSNFRDLGEFYRMYCHTTCDIINGEVK